MTEKRERFGGSVRFSTYYVTIRENQTDRLLQEQRQKKEGTIYRAPTGETSKAKGISEK